MLEEDLDDTHLCIKCSATIVGLDNYVEHRKTNCGGKTSRNPIVPGYDGFGYPDDTSGYVKSETTGGKTTKTLSDPYDLPDELGADVFFSSLQLQSVQASSGGKTSSSQQMLTRKATATILSSGTGAEAEAEGEWPVDATNNSDNLMKVVRDIGESKKFETIFKPIAFTHGSPDPDQSDDDDDNDDQFDDEDDDDEDYVPSFYSGGKWKPGSLPSPRNGGKTKSSATPPAPPPGHTGLKAAKSPIERCKAIQTAGKATPESSSSDDLLSLIRAKLKSNREYIPKGALSAPFMTEEGGKWKSERKGKFLGGQDSPDVMEAQTGGKWKPGCSKVSTGGKGKSFGGEDSPDVMEAQISGKWKPSYFKAPTGGKGKFIGGQDSPDVMEAQTGGKWKPGCSVLSIGGKGKSFGGEDSTDVMEAQTGGKWKPGYSKESVGGKRESLGGQDSPDVMEAQTSGKWKPGYSKESVGGKGKSLGGQDSPDVMEAQTGGKWKPGYSKESAEGKGKSLGGQDSPDVMEAQTGGKWKPGYSKESAEGKGKSLGDQDYPDVMEAQTGGKWKPGCSKTSISGKWTSLRDQDSPELVVARIGGKWKSTATKRKSSDVQELSNELDPPAGGKWKPGTLKAIKLQSTGGKWKSAEGNESPDVLETHITGKWKPGQQPRDQPETTEPSWDDQEAWSEVGESQSPLEHTKGKWAPGLKTEKPESVEEESPSPPQDFWCKICCRRLKTRTIYEKHLKSRKHLKRSETEQQLARVAVDNLALAPQYTVPSEAPVERAESPESDPDKRKRRKTYTRCEVCKHRVRKTLIGKHLISHYHYVQTASNPNKSLSMILDNIHQIVLQSPFQCTPCRFYANTEEAFLNHWNSKGHRDKTEGPGKFWCSFCSFECEDNNQMRRHLLSMEHREAILALNRSVPICITKKVVIECPKCHQGFRYNMELRNHAVRCDNSKETPKSTASDEYQSRYRCKLCPDEVLKSKTALQRHEKFKHDKHNYFCSVCDMEFDDPCIALKHRKTTSHRKMSAVKSKKIKREQKMESKNEAQCEECDHVSSSDVEAMLHQLTHTQDYRKSDQKIEKKTPEPEVSTIQPDKDKNTIRKCPYCKDTFKTKSDLKNHINTVHPEFKHSCPLCGESFALTQELTSHRRYKMCAAYNSRQPPPPTPSKEDQLTPKTIYKCSECTYESIFESELIFHRIMHTQGLEALQSVGEKINCPVCERPFGYYSLRQHLRQHTNEKAYACHICGRSFSRRNNYKEHMQYLHAVGGEKKRKQYPKNTASFICDMCGKTFRTKYSLKLHINIHTKRDKKNQCPVEQCQYVGRNKGAVDLHVTTHVVETTFKCEMEECMYQGKSAYHLKRHMKSHLKTEKVYECPECDFKAKIPGHIKRHMRIHTGECPYQCPHCDYKCGYIENLRKHVLTTKKHPGKFLYQCSKCDPKIQFRTNFHSEFQQHLATVHADYFVSFFDPNQ